VDITLYRFGEEKDMTDKENVYPKMSKPEKVVAEFLTEFNILWNYERPVIVKDEGGRPRKWYPDFYLSDFGIYVEVCGSERDADYERKKKVYKDNHLHVMFIQTYKDVKKWKPILIDEITKIQTRREDLFLDSLF
jgi:hypothetical protein